MNVTTHQRGAKDADCRFCSLLNGADDSFDSCWMAEGSYKAIVSAGTLVPGWTLICPTHHIVNLSDDYRTNGYWRFASAVSEVLVSRYGDCAMFEHGAANEVSLTGCGVGHAHSHLVPLHFSLEEAARGASPDLFWHECQAKDIKALAKGNEYLFVASKFSENRTTGSLCLLKSPTSQFFRKVIANKLGIAEQYDYKKYPRLDVASNSAQELRMYSNALEV